MASRPDHVVLNAARARLGRYGRQVLWVLLVSTALGGVALFAAWTWRAPSRSAAPEIRQAAAGAVP